MSEERFVSTPSAKSEDAAGSPSQGARPAIKSRNSDHDRESGSRTSGPTSLFFDQEVRQSDSSRAEARRQHSVATETADYSVFREVCDRLVAEIKRADDYLVDGSVSETGMEVVVEVEQLLDELYQTRWGKKECLKRIVVTINSQINNVRWTQAHVEFLKDILVLLRNSYLIDDSLIEECYKLIKEHGLDAFRGTISDAEVRKKYRIVEIE